VRGLARKRYSVAQIEGQTLREKKGAKIPSKKKSIAIHAEKKIL